MNKKLFKEALQIFKDNAGYTGEYDYNQHKVFNDIEVYFGKKDGDIKDFCIIKYKNIIVQQAPSGYSLQTEYQENPFSISFDYLEWIKAVKEKIQDNSINHDEELFFNNPIQEVRIIKEETQVENSEHKVKADILDQILSSKNLTN